MYWQNLFSCFCLQFCVISSDDLLCLQLSVFTILHLFFFFFGSFNIFFPPFFALFLCVFNNVISKIIYWHRIYFVLMCKCENKIYAFFQISSLTFLRDSNITNAKIYFLAFWAAAAEWRKKKRWFDLIDSIENSICHINATRKRRKFAKCHIVRESIKAITFKQRRKKMHTNTHAIISNKLIRVTIQFGKFNKKKKKNCWISMQML